MLAAAAVCLSLFAACGKKTVSMEEEDTPPITTTTESAPQETETESESIPVVPAESETLTEQEGETETESEAAPTESEVESEFAEAVYYAARIDGFDINRGKLDLTMCTLSEGANTNKLTAGDFSPTEETRSLILPDNTKVIDATSSKMSIVSMEDICTDIFVLVEGDEDYMELYLYMN